MKLKKVAVLMFVGLGMLGLLWATTSATLASYKNDPVRTWFVGLSFDGLEASAADEVYEGWIIVDGQPVSTGTFTVADDGALSQYNFAFEARRSQIGAFVLTIEPVPDNDPAPSDVHVLAGDFARRYAELTTDHPAVSEEYQGKDISGTAVIYKAIRYEVTIENLTPGQPFSPPVVATHRRSANLFRMGRLASPEIEAIAEDGDASGAAALLRGWAQTADVVSLGVPLTPNGSTAGGFSDTITFEILARPGDRLSLATMLICTNDGFAGLDRAKLPRHGSRSFYAKGYDAGTEMNTELSQDIVDPCSGIGPAPLNGDPNGNEDALVDSDPHMPIRRHAGIQGNGDLTEAHDWDGPAAKVTVTRLGN